MIYIKYIKFWFIPWVFQSFIPEGSSATTKNSKILRYEKGDRQRTKHILCPAQQQMIPPQFPSLNKNNVVTASAYPAPVQLLPRCYIE